MSFFLPLLDRSNRAKFSSLAIVLSLALAGCSTTHWSGTQRTGTEQVLISEAVDLAVSRVNVHLLKGKTAFLDVQYLGGVTDKDYLISATRQQLVTNGIILKKTEEEADYIIELRSGGVGTDRNEAMLLGIPRMPANPLLGMPATPELALIKSTEQIATAKLSLFAYHRESGKPVWQSGSVRDESRLERTWVLGAGPVEWSSMPIEHFGGLTAPLGGAGLFSLGKDNNLIPHEPFKFGNSKTKAEAPGKAQCELQSEVYNPLTEEIVFEAYSPSSAPIPPAPAQSTGSFPAPEQPVEESPAPDSEKPPAAPPASPAEELPSLELTPLPTTEEGPEMQPQTNEETEAPEMSQEEDKPAPAVPTPKEEKPETPSIRLYRF